MDPINPVNTEIPTIKPLQLSAPQDSVDQFNSLLSGQLNLLRNGNTSLSNHREPSKIMHGTLVEDTANRLNKAEVALDELGWEIRKSTQHLDTNTIMDSNLVQSISELKYKTTSYFMNMMRTESGFSSLSEETESITKRRGQ